jgi:hypothetical protein
LGKTASLSLTRNISPVKMNQYILSCKSKATRQQAGRLTRSTKRMDGKTARVTRRLLRSDGSPQGRTTKRSIVGVNGGEARGSAYGDS